MKRFFTLILLAVLGMTSVWAGTFYYLKPNSDWTTASAKFGFRQWKSGTTVTLMDAVPGTNSAVYYYNTGTSDYGTSWQFVRLNPSNTNNIWNYGPNASNGKNCCTITGWSSSGTWSTYVPPMKSVTIADNGTTVSSGDGSQSNPYMIEGGATIKVKGSASMQVDDTNPTFQYKYSTDGGSNFGDYGTSNTYEITASTVAETSYAITVQSCASYNSVSNSAVTASNTIYYTVISPSATKYTIRFLNYDGTVLQSGDVPENTTPSYKGGTPTKESTTTIEYTFAGWDPAIAMVTKDQDYTATYTESARKYTLTWNLDGGTITTAGTEAGQVANGATLTAPVVEKTGYTFKSWNPAVPETMPAADAGYTAVWEKNPAPKVYFINKQGWTTPYCHAWNSSNTPEAAWHGTAMVDEGYTINGYEVYSHELKDATYSKCLFNDNSNSKTADLTWTDGYYYYDGTWYAPADLFTVSYGTPAVEGCTLTAKAGKDLASGAKVTKNLSVTFTATAADGYTAEGFYSDDAFQSKLQDAAGSKATYQVSITADAAVYAKFVQATKYNITYTDNEHIDSYTDQVNQSIAGNTVTVKPVAATGYQATGITVTKTEDGSAVSSDDAAPFTFTMPDYDVTVTVTTAERPSIKLYALTKSDYDNVKLHTWSGSNLEFIDSPSSSNPYAMNKLGTTGSCNLFEVSYYGTTNFILFTGNSVSDNKKFTGDVSNLTAAGTYFYNFKDVTASSNPTTPTPSTGFTDLSIAVSDKSDAKKDEALDLSTLVSCSGTLAEAGVAFTSTYYINDVEVTSPWTPTAAGNYTLRVSVNGITKTAEGNATITVVIVPSVTLEADVENAYVGDKITLTAEAKNFSATPTITYSVAKDGGEATACEAEYTPTAAGNYVFTAKAVNGSEEATSSEVTVSVTDLPTYYIKHPWNGGDWTWKQLTRIDGTRTFAIVDYYGAAGCNWNTKADDDGRKWIEYPSKFCNPVKGDMAKFVLNPDAGTITITKMYSRSVTSGRYGTICLPYAVKAGEISGVDGIYSIAGYRGAQTTPTSMVLAEETGDLTAGQPYIFLANGAQLVALYTGEKATAAGNYNGLYGSFEYMDVAEGKYLISNNKIMECGTGCSINANRAYIDMENVPAYENNAAPGRIVELQFPTTSGVQTGLDVLNVNGENQKFLLNGQLYIRHNGQLFNAAGQLIK